MEECHWANPWAGERWRRTARHIAALLQSRSCPNHAAQELHQQGWTQRASQAATAANNLPASAGDTADLGSFSGSGRSPGGGSGNPLQHSCLENSTDRRAWWASVHGIEKSWTRQSTHAHT